MRPFYIFTMLTIATLYFLLNSSSVDTIKAQNNNLNYANISSLGCNIKIRTGQVFRGERNLVVASAPPAANGCDIDNPQAGTIAILRPSGESQVIKLPKDISNNIKLIDVIDLNGDGEDEIIGVNDNTISDEESLGGLFIYNALNLEKPLLLLKGQQQEVADERYTNESITADSIKIYKLNNGNYGLVVAGGVAGTTFDATIHFYQLDKNGVIHDNPQKFPSPCQRPGCNDALSYPMIAVDDIDGDGFKEVVIMAKAKVLVFKGDGTTIKDAGTPLYYTQFVDPYAGFTNYNVFRDYNGEYGPIGYRYGQMEIVRDLNGDGIKDLIVTADALPILSYENYSYPRMIIEAFKLQPPNNARGGYLQHLGPLTSPNTSPSFAGIIVEGANRLSDTLPGAPPLGSNINSIKDVNGDGFPEVIVSGRHNKKLFTDIYTFNIKNGWQKLKRLSGTCLDIINLDINSQPQLPDIIIWNSIASRIDLFRWDTASKKFAMVTESISSTNAPALQDATNFTLSQRYGDYEKHGSDSGFNRLAISIFQGNKQFIEEAKSTNGVDTCGSLKSWDTNNRHLNIGLDIETRPGRLLFIDDESGFYFFNLFNNCQPDGKLGIFTRENNKFVPIN